MMRWERALALVGACLLLAPAGWAAAESVEIVTYYPSPATTTDDLKVKRVSVGENYKALNLDDALAKIEDGTLLVQREVGIGLPTTAPVPFSTAPGTHQAPNGKPGNLDVNDIWLRSAQVWASQAFAESVAPPKPYTVVLGLTPGGPLDLTIPGSGRPDLEGSVMTYDVYAALQLWKYGVTPDQVRITSYQLQYWFGEIGGGSSGSWNGNPPGFWPPRVDRPSMQHGTVVVHMFNTGHGQLNVDVTW